MARYLLFLLSFSFLLSDTSIRQNIRIKHNLEGLLNLSQFQSRNEQELIDFIESVMESDNIPGLSISVVKGEHVIWNKSFGLANVEENIIVSDSTMFMLASVSKTVTATALMQLWENGAINLDSDINENLIVELYSK